MFSSLVDPNAKYRNQAGFKLTHVGSNQITASVAHNGCPPPSFPAYGSQIAQTYFKILFQMLVSERFQDCISKDLHLFKF